MKRILMIGTGGTIASKQTEDGLSPGLTPEDILRYIPQIENICEVDCIEILNIDSTNITPRHWRVMTSCIERYYENYDGFVVTHGTDTMAFTAAALSYMIQNSQKPIVITGAQKPIEMDITDAKTNLIDSFIYASSDEAHDVSIVFDGKVIAGTRARKVRAKSYDAFASLNFPYLAVIQDGMLVSYIDRPLKPEKVEFSYEMDESVYVLKLIPGLKPDILSILFEKYDCIIIESFGVGGIPDTLTDVFYREMEKWKSSGKFVVITTQVANEGSNMTVYEVGRKVKRDFELLESHDMTLEAVTTKMMWLMGRGITDCEEMKKEFYTEINYDILFDRRFL